MGRSKTSGTRGRDEGWGGQGWDMYNLGGNGRGGFEERQMRRKTGGGEDVGMKDRDEV